MNKDKHNKDVCFHGERLQAVCLLFGNKPLVSLTNPIYEDTMRDDNLFGIVHLLLHKLYTLFFESPPHT